MPGILSLVLIGCMLFAIFIGFPILFGTLGILISPSIMLVVMGPILEVPVTDLFAAAIMPGILLGGPLEWVPIILIIVPILLPLIISLASI
ncbi:MAG: hypothetical protein R3F53_09840 [Gammaproteobacteria bacterium]